jgi:Flp pilus assembly protein TadB
MGEIASNTYTKDKRAAIAWTGTTLGAVALAAAGWAHTKLWDHDQKATAQAERIAAIEKATEQRISAVERATEQRISAVEKSAEQRLTATDKRLDTMDSKLDRILERLPAKP